MPSLPRLALTAWQVSSFVDELCPRLSSRSHPSPSRRSGRRPSFASMAFVAARVPPTLEAHRETMAEMVPVESPTPIRLPGSVWMRLALTAP